MWTQEPFYDLPCILNVYNRKLTNWQYLCSEYQTKINRNIASLPFDKSIISNSGRRHTEETKLKISKANKGKRLGCAPWNKGRKLHYITGKREHTEETKKKMSEAAKRRWMQHE
jgi:hypothetical protein